MACVRFQACSLHPELATEKCRRTASRRRRPSTCLNIENIFTWKMDKAKQMHRCFNTRPIECTLDGHTCGTLSVHNLLQQPVERSAYTPQHCCTTFFGAPREGGSSVHTNPGHLYTQTQVICTHRAVWG